jgi:hypothetical protein
MPFLTKSRIQNKISEGQKKSKTEENVLKETETDENSELIKEYNLLVKDLKQKQELLRRFNLVKSYKSRVTDFFFIYEK